MSVNRGGACTRSSSAIPPSVGKSRNAKTRQSYVPRRASSWCANNRSSVRWAHAKTSVGLASMDGERVQCPMWQRHHTDPSMVPRRVPSNVDHANQIQTDAEEGIGHDCAPLRRRQAAQATVLFLATKAASGRFARSLIGQLRSFRFGPKILPETGRSRRPRIAIGALRSRGAAVIEGL